jgi:hypothetical protein
MALVLCHVVGVPLDAELPNLRDTRGTVGAEEEREELGNEVIELPARLRQRELCAVRTGAVLVLAAAGSDLAPGGPDVIMAPPALVSQVRSARSAVQAAVGNQMRIG